MATTARLPLLLLSLSVIALAAHARPCKTLFFYTSTTTSYYPSHPLNPNPNPNLDTLFAFDKSRPYSPKFFTFFLTTAKGPADSRHPRVSYISLRRAPLRLYYSDHADQKLLHQNDSASKPSDDAALPLGTNSTVSSRSIRDRTKDIMSVVGALLFGVGCGALTAATMFLIWSLFAPHRFEFEDSEDDDGDDNDKDENRRFGYVAIPDDIDLIKKGIAAAQKKNGYVAIPADSEA